MFRLLAASVVCASVVCASAMHAQLATAVGVVVDSVHGGPLVGAIWTGRSGGST